MDSIGTVTLLLLAFSASLTVGESKLNYFAYYGHEGVSLFLFILLNSFMYAPKLLLMLLHSPLQS